MRKETWKPAVGWEGLYEVSDAGHVRSVDRIVVDTRGGIRNYRGRPIVGRVQAAGGHLTVSLPPPHEVERVRLQRATYYIHRLVAEAFLGPPPFARALVRHLDGDPANNRVENLAWGTYGENLADLHRHNAERAAAPLLARIAELEAEVARLTASLAPAQ